MAIAPSVASPAASKSAVPVELHYALSTNDMAASSSSKGASTQSTASRHLAYIATSNTSITVSVTPIGGSTTSYGPTACTSSSCVVSFTAVPGPTLLAFTLTDASSNVLSNFSTTTIVQPSNLNTLFFTANPVVSSVSLQLANASVNGGTPTNDLLTIKAMDADGNTIVGNSSYVDVYGNPVAFTLNVTNNQSGGKGTVTIQGPSYITGQSQSATYARYDGNWLNSSSISVTSNNANVTSLTGATLTTVPSIANEYSVASVSYPGLITNGPDGNIWFTENSNNVIGYTTPQGQVTQYSIPTSNSQPYGIATGPDGNIWFTESSKNKIGRVTTSGVFTEYTLSTGADPQGLTVGPDGQLWFAEESANKIGSFNINSHVIHQYLVPTTTSNPEFITTGPDKNLWFTEIAGGKIGRITTSGVITDFSTPTSSSSPYGIVTGPDGNLWFTETGRIGKSDVYGNITEYTLPNTSDSLYGIIVGPDGNLWFSDYFANKIGSITTSGSITEYSAAAGSYPYQMIVGSNGNLWLTEQGTSKIGTFVF